MLAGICFILPIEVSEATKPESMIRSMRNSPLSSRSQGKHSLKSRPRRHDPHKYNDERGTKEAKTGQHPFMQSPEINSYLKALSVHL